MEYKKYGNEYLLRVDKGEKIAQSLRILCEREGIECGGVYGLGAADHVERFRGLLEENIPRR